jgi:hypothetical protein
MTLEADEFIRRLLIHALPRGFPRIRHYRLLALIPGRRHSPSLEKLEIGGRK